MMARGFASQVDLIKRADAFAALAHATPRWGYPNGQKRKYTNEPYIVHPRAVAKIVGEIVPPDSKSSEIMIAAALLHDVLEDTDVTVRELRRVFGDEIAGLVIEVTDVSEPRHGNREARKAIDRAHLAVVSGNAQTIKAADLIDNMATIADHDPAFAKKVYLPEKRAILGVLKRANPIILGMAWDTLWRAEEKANANYKVSG